MKFLSIAVAIFGLVACGALVSARPQQQCEEILKAIREYTLDSEDFGGAENQMLAACSSISEGNQELCYHFLNTYGTDILKTAADSHLGTICSLIGQWLVVENDGNGGDDFVFESEIEPVEQPESETEQVELSTEGGTCGRYPRSCMDVYKANPSSQDGSYLLQHACGKPFEVYCDFEKGHGYTYIANTNFGGNDIKLNIKELYDDISHVIIRHMRKDGSQWEAMLEQIQRYRRTPLSVQFNQYVGYKAPQNKNLQPFVYLGFIPASSVHKGDIEGYQVNGNDELFKNCDGNPNSYITFLFNKKKLDFVKYGPYDSPLMHKWVNKATVIPKQNNIPCNYFSEFEIHFGGCGGYATSQQFSTVAGAALGLRYNIKCSDPEDTSHGTKTFTGTEVGSSVTYTCDDGYTKSHGDATMTCSETGQWTGIKTTCAKL